MGKSTVKWQSTRIYHQIDTISQEQSSSVAFKYFPLIDIHDPFVAVNKLTNITLHKIFGEHISPFAHFRA